MPSWWRKSSNESNKKSSRQSIIDWHRKCIRPGTSRKCTSDTSQSGKDSRSPPPSIQVSRSLSFGERPQAQPLPLPGYRANCGNIASTESSVGGNSKNALFPPHSKPGRVKISQHGVNGERDLASNYSGSLSDTDDPSNSRILSPQTSDYESGIQSAIASPGVKQVDQFPYANKKNSRQMLTPKNVLSVPVSPKLRPLSAPDSSMSSPSRSPMRFLGQEPVANTSFWLGPGQCSSPGSCSTSVAGDIPSQLLWPHGRCSPECSPVPSPGITSPCPSSRMQSGTSTPLHPRVGGPLTESPRARPNDGKQKSHRLPLPPVTIPTSFSPSFVSGSSPGIQRSPDNPSSPGSPWKKGRLLGRGTFGQVYIGFNSESGEMCAMKEVTLFSDDAKSKESVLQFGQEIALLSRLRHPNIVQYFGSATFDDKLYIYLEYVSGGSIHKILQEYGQLGEAAIRSYTQQILSGLSYLHAKNTLHRDIKGANILVDPNGRVKLADFGMAKHITGQSCPLSLKGSPYWMAPEVIKNSGTCNFAVDIWSLGCTVYEMATTKPPWSQYEGVAAMFKIGNSKELPVIPDTLSDEGKDFVRLCLQRNPFKRPTAAQLLEHPFVKSTASLERPFLSAEPKATPGALRSMRSLGFEHSRLPTNVNSPRAVNHSKSLKAAPGFSDTYVARNKSSSISPTESRLPHSQSLSQHINGRLSPSLILSPQATSGYSTPCGGNCALPLYRHPQPPTSYLKETAGMIGSFQTNLNLNMREQKRPDAFRGIVQAHLSRETVSRGSARNKSEPAMLQEKRYDAHLILADQVSRQLLINPLRLNPEVDINPNCPTPSCNN